MAMFKTCPYCGSNLDYKEQCTCSGVSTAVLRTPRELVKDRMAAMEQAKARAKQTAHATLRKGIYTAICRQTKTQ